MDGLDVDVSSEGDNAVQVIDAAKKIKCALVQIQCLHCICMTTASQRMQRLAFLPIHLVASEVPRPGRGYGQGVSRTCKCANICHLDAR